MQIKLPRIYKLGQNTKSSVILTIIILFGFFLRIFNIDWDKGLMFHPDERAIYMFTTQLEYPSSIEEFLSPQSPLNPNFFAYGTFPIYLLKITSDIVAVISPMFSQYGGIYLVGRIINSLASTATIFIVFLLAKKLFDIKTGLLAAFLFAIAVFPIQNSHFYTVDTLLTLFILTSIFFGVLYMEESSAKNALFGGVFLGLALATKISALPIFLIIFVCFILAYLKKTRKISLELLIKHSFNFLFLAFSSIFVFFITQPYVLIDFKNFFEQVSIQSKMGSDPFIFPYTLQYVGKIPILFETKNIFFWGLGIPLSILSFAGVIYLSIKIIRNLKKNSHLIPVLFFFWLFYLLSSSYSVGWMRYLLPIYPILTMCAAAFSVQVIFKWLLKQIPALHNMTTKKIFLLLFLTLLSIWTASFLSIYIKEHTKIKSSTWINENIQPSSTIAIEHWDDQLPIYGVENYKFETLALYEPDTDVKWETINRQLDNSDYIILASNRLYTPLQKLTDCKSLPEGKCYKKTADYYKKLFSEELGFKKIAEFTSYPTVPIINLEINDQSADESFTVYDHPKIIVFEKE